MKTFKYITCLGIILLMGSAGFAQNPNSSVINQVDPKLSLKQQLAVLKAGENNPSRAAHESDPKIKPDQLPTEQDYGVSNANPQSLEDPKLVDFEKNQQNQLGSETRDNHLSTPTKAEQPEGERAENVINYRHINGNPDQVAGEQPDNVVNYRNIKGDNKQPEGDPPK
jgi:hypothetical protein